MQAASTLFHESAAATVRYPRAKVEITWTDPFIDSTISPYSLEVNRINWLYQVADLVTETGRKWAHLDGVIKPDGTYYPMPSTANEAAAAQMGWYGKTACDGAGNWTGPYPILSINFAARPVLAFYVKGDTQYNEYPVDFTVYAYNDLTQVYSQAVTGNDSIEWSTLLETPITEATSIGILVTKWSAPNRVVKISEFYTSVVETYYSDDIKSISILEERELTNGSLPIGNISANECDLELSNINLTRSNGDIVLDPFFPGNTNSIYHSLVKKNRRMKIWFGFQYRLSGSQSLQQYIQHAESIVDDSAPWQDAETLKSLSGDPAQLDDLQDGEGNDFVAEYVPMGVFWSGDWQCDELGTTVSTTGRDRMELLRKATYFNSSMYEDVSLYTLAQTVLEDARTSIPMYDLSYQIDEELQDYVVRYAFFPKKSYFDTIRDIVVACMGQAFMSRDDVLIIDGPSAMES